MGGSVWNHWVAYQPSAAAALQALRDDIFARRAFYMGNTPMYAKAKTIDDARAIGAECGTNSVLDIAKGVAPVPTFGCSSALTDAQLLALFETTQPRRAAVEAERQALQDLCDHYECVHVVVYDEADAPAWLFFIGFSGD